MKQKPVFTVEWLKTTACAPLNPQVVGDDKKGKRKKFGNNPCEVDGIKFQSQKEAKRYGVLRMRLKAGGNRVVGVAEALPADTGKRYRRKV